MKRPTCTLQLQRESRRLVRKLVRCNGFLDRPHGGVKQQSGWNLMSAKNKYARPVEVVLNTLVEDMCGNGWLQRTPAGVVRVSNGAKILFEHTESVAGGEGCGNNQNRLITTESLPDEDGCMREVVRNEAENPLLWLRRRKDKNGSPFISQEQFDAGELFRRDYTLAQLEPSITAKWSGAIRAGKRQTHQWTEDVLIGAERTLASRQRFQKAVEAIGPLLASITLEVCCLSRGLEAAERRLGYPRRSGRILLQVALENLAVHYRLVQPHRIALPDPNVSSFASPDCRPKA